MAINIDTDKCTGCGSCTEICSLDALTVENGFAVVDAELCAECGACIDACPADAISLP